MVKAWALLFGALVVFLFGFEKMLFDIGDADGVNWMGAQEVGRAALAHGGGKAFPELDCGFGVVAGARHIMQTNLVGFGFLLTAVAEESELSADGIGELKSALPAGVS